MKYYFKKLLAAFVFAMLLMPTAFADFTDTLWEKPYGGSYIQPTDGNDVQIGNLTVTGTLTFSGTAGADLDMGGFNIDNLGVAFLIEQAAAHPDVAGSGQIWVKSATPNEL